MIFRITLGAILLVILSFSSCMGASLGRVYHIKFDWKTEPAASRFYDMTRYIFKSMRKKEGVLLYSEYGMLDGVHIWISNPKSLAKLEKTITDADQDDIHPVIDYDATLKTPLHKMYAGDKAEQVNLACEVYKTKEFSKMKRHGNIS